MKTTVIFLVLLALSSMTSAQKAFDQVRNLLTNFRDDIVKEQHDADVRNEKDEKECADKIAAAEKKVADRQKDVDDLKAHIQWLENEKSESEKDKKTREDRIEANAKLLADFKKQRCDNNLLFVKQLREHMEAIDIMTLLRGDINDYFANKKESGKVNTAFIERFAEFSHLLSDDNKQVFMQLSQAVNSLPDVDALSKRVDDSTSTKERTTEEVGDKHVDNDKGELQKMEHVAWEETDAYNDKLHKKVIDMIDGLIAHLKASRDELTKNEIKAAEDFAVFQTNMEKENEYLQAKIEELKKHIVDLTNQINVANVQLEKREKLLQDAKDELETIRNICKEKKEYYENESRRRSSEIQTVDVATGIFNDILSKLSERVKERAAALNAGAKDAGNDLSKFVKKDENEIATGVNSRAGERNQVVF